MPQLTRLSRLSPRQHQDECRPVKHVLFSAWPDHQTPESAGPLLRLMAEVDESPEAAASTGPIVVHCRYGGPPSMQPAGQGPVPPVGLSWAGPLLTDRNLSLQPALR